MNPQLASLIRSALKIIGTLLVAHGASNVGNALMVEPMVELVGGLVTGAVGFYLSTKKASQIPVVAVPTGNVAPDGSTEFAVRPANAVITASNPTPQKIVDLKPEVKTTTPPST